MNADLVETIATQVVNQTILYNWKYWLLVVAIVLVVGFFASWGGGYASKRGEFKAAQADRKKILEGLAETTKTTANINSIASLGEWSERERRTLRRTKLEELVRSAAVAFEWLEKETTRCLMVEDQGELSPLPTVDMLGELYFEEIRPAVSAYTRAHRACGIVLTQVYVDLLRVQSESAVRGVIAVHAEQNAIRAAKGASINEAKITAYRALLDLNSAAAALMKGIIAVHPAQDP